MPRHTHTCVHKKLESIEKAKMLSLFKNTWKNIEKLENMKNMKNIESMLRIWNRKNVKIIKKVKKHNNIKMYE